MTKKIEIEVGEDAESDLADITCFMYGYIEAKGEDWRFSWLKDSLKTLSEIKLQIRNKTNRNELPTPNEGQSFSKGG